MKKMLSIIAGMSMFLSLASCSETTEKPSAGILSETLPTTTSSAPETTTFESTTAINLTLDKEYSCEDIAFDVPYSANKQGTIPNGDTKITLINFNDTSEIRVVVTKNTSGITFSQATEEQLKEVLNNYADSFSSTFSKSDNDKNIILPFGNAIRQALSNKDSYMIAVHFLYNDNVYTIGFMDTEAKQDTIAIQIADEVIKSIRVKNVLTSAEIATEKHTEPPAPVSSISKGQENALKQAKSYISHSAFSYNELIEQLEFEKYTHDEAVYGADNCGADWNAEALEQAQSYISHSAFSYSELYDQLIYGQFTSEQAQYGVDNCGADWNAEAVEQAESYLSHSSFSREELYDQLIYEGFTPEQAEHGVSAVY